MQWLVNPFCGITASTVNEFILSVQKSDISAVGKNWWDKLKAINIKSNSEWKWIKGHIILKVTNESERPRILWARQNIYPDFSFHVTAHMSAVGTFS